jgi:integrase
MEEVGKVPNLVRRGAVYRCRMRCPQHLLRAGMPPESSISLYTKERSIALERLPAARLKLMEFFQSGPTKERAVASAIVPTFTRLRRPDHPDLPLLSTKEAEALAEDFFRTAYSELDASTADLADMTREQRAHWALELTDRIASLDDPSPDEEDLAFSAEIAVLRKAGRRAHFTSEPSRLLRAYLRRALTQIWRIEVDRARGDYRDRVTDRMFAPVEAGATRIASAMTSSSGVTLAALIDQFDRDFIAGEAITSKTMNKNRAALAIIGRYFGGDLDVASIDGEALRGFRDTLAKLPPNVTKKFGREADLGAVAQQNEEAGGPALNRETQTTYLRLLGNLFEFAKDRRYVPHNEASKLRPKGRATPAQARRRPFAVEQLRTIFSAPIYTGCVDDVRNYAKHGPNRPRRSRFWVPLIALFTGLRMEEIFQLTPAHVQTGRDGLPFLLISPDMQVKTDNAFREVPVHRELLRVGFMAFVAERRQRGERNPLFDDVTPAPDGYRSTNFSKRFATFLKSLGIKDDPRRTCFHSFRHNFRDGLRQPNANPDFVREAGGWATRETSDFYGDGTRAHLLRDLIDGIDYDLDLRHLYQTGAIKN